MQNPLGQECIPRGFDFFTACLRPECSLTLIRIANPCFMQRRHLPLVEPVPG